MSLKKMAMTPLSAVVCELPVKAFDLLKGKSFHKIHKNILEDSYKEVDLVHPFEATFYDNKIAETYQQYKATYTVISFLAFLAISISTLGLLGMAAFATESRMKEISIRNVLGARVRNLMLLLSRDFLVMIVLAGLVAIPVTLYIVENMVLNEFLYRAEIGPIEILSGFTIVMVISALTIG